MLRTILFALGLCLSVIWAFLAFNETSPRIQLGSDSCTPTQQQQTAKERRRAIILYEQSDYQGSLLAFDKVVGLCPNIWDFRYRAYARMSLGDSLGAEAEVDEVIRRNPYEIDLLPIKAYALMARSSCDSAADLYRRVLQVEREDPYLQLCLGNALTCQGQYEDALKSFGQAIALDNAYAEAYSYRAGTYLQLSMNEQALGDIRKAIRLWPQDSYFRLQLAEVLFMMGRYAESLQASNQSLQLQEYAEAHLLKGKALLRLGKRTEALSELQAAKAAGLEEAGKLLENY